MVKVSRGRAAPQKVLQAGCRLLGTGPVAAAPSRSCQVCGISLQSGPKARTPRTANAYTILSRRSGMARAFSLAVGPPGCDNRSKARPRQKCYRSRGVRRRDKSALWCLPERGAQGETIRRVRAFAAQPPTPSPLASASYGLGESEHASAKEFGLSRVDPVPVFSPGKRCGQSRGVRLKARSGQDGSIRGARGSGKRPFVS